MSKIKYLKLNQTNPYSPQLFSITATLLLLLKTLNRGLCLLFASGHFISRSNIWFIKNFIQERFKFVFCLLFLRNFCYSLIWKLNPGFPGLFGRSMLLYADQVRPPPLSPPPAPLLLLLIFLLLLLILTLPTPQSHRLLAFKL